MEKETKKSGCNNVKKRVRPTVMQVKTLQNELSILQEKYRLQLLADKHLAEELDACKLKLKKTTEQLYIVGMKQGCVVKVCDGYERELNEGFSKKLCYYQEILESQIDGTSSLVKECDAWREKYRSMISNFEQSNRLLKEELERFRSSNIEINKECVKLASELSSLKHRGFLSRLFGKQ